LVSVAGDRYLARDIRSDAVAGGKLALLSGPRQVGKTTLAKTMLSSPQNYKSWDDPEFRKSWARSPRQALADRGPGPVVLDELHKDKRWKSRLKGFYDVEGAAEGIIVTGSARLEIYRRGGDSLMGRYLPYRLHPLTVAESATSVGPDEILGNAVPRYPLTDILRLGGFPEPFFGGSEGRARRWSRLRLERLVAEDVRDLRAVGDLAGLRMLTDLLPERVGSLLSINALREDIGVAHMTAQAWLQTLEALYHCFFVRPYAERITRAIRSAPKLYLFDLLQIGADRRPARLENVTALHLLKACDYWTDLAQGEFELRFVRDKEQREVDFLVLRDKRPWMLVECQSNDIQPSVALGHFQQVLRVPAAYQLVVRPGYDRAYPAAALRVLDYERFFAGLV
jgi:predicted AAA+ superfamily ATPase